MPHVREHVIGENRKKLDFLSGQKEILGQIFEAVTEMGNQNSILIKNEEAVLQRNWVSDEEEDSNECEGEAYMSQAKEESVLGLKAANLVAKISQGVEGHSLKVVKKEKEKSLC